MPSVPGEVDGGRAPRSPPVQSRIPAELPGRWTQLAVGLDHACGIGTNGSLSCWGDNTFGRLGVSTLASHNTPLQVGAEHDWRSVVTGFAHTCALKTDDSLWCWGSNDLGEVGDGTGWTRELHLVP